MKTAMRQLIWLMDDGIGGLDESIKVSEIWKKANELLQTEKAQIIEAFNEGASNYVDSINMQSAELQKSGEDYYTQTFND